MTDPTESFADALAVALHPSGYQDHVRSDLFDRGYERWHGDSGDADLEEFISALEQFTTYALDGEFTLDEQQRPLVDHPAVLTIIASHAAFIVDNHDVYENVKPRNNQMLADIKELAGKVFVDLMKTNPGKVHFQGLAEGLYRKPLDGEHPFSGRICTDVTSDPPIDGPANAYLEIPLVAASKKVLVTTKSSPEDVPVNDGRTFRSRLHDNKVYVPVDDFYRRAKDLWLDEFSNHFDFVYSAVPGEQKEMVLDEERDISREIERAHRSGHTERLYLNYDPARDKLKLLTKAVKQARDEAAKLGDPLTAKQLHGCIRAYTPSEYEEDLVDELHNPRAIAQFLAENTDKKHVEKQEGVEKNSYVLLPMSRGSKNVPIHDLEDIFEFPCFQNIDERLQEEGPTRKELYSLVRWLFWLPQYYHNDNDREFIEDVKDLFSRWPWYDEQTTEYQVNYELLQDIRGEDPLPIGCNNDDMQLYCIGKEECPYSLYGSVDFPEEVYDRLDDTGTGWT